MSLRREVERRMYTYAGRSDAVVSVAEWLARLTAVCVRVYSPHKVIHRIRLKITLLNDSGRLPDR